MKGLSGFAAFFLLLLMSPSLKAISIASTNDGGALIAGADPFFWANTSYAVDGSIDDAAAPTSCGADCANYSLGSLELTVGGINNYSVINPDLQVTYNPSGDSLYELSGLIVVIDTYVLEFDLSLDLPAGVLDPGSLSAPPQFAATALDAANPGLFQYAIVAGGVGAAQIALVDGSVSAVSSTPEPASMLLTAAGAMLLGLKLKQSRKIS